MITAGIPPSIISERDNGNTLLATLAGSVLFIDDEEVIRTIGCEMLQLLGMSCISAANGQDGLDYFRKNCSLIDLVILDVEMPGLSGEKVFHLLQEIRPEVPILIASGYSKEYLENKVFKRKIVNFIPKPFNLERLAHQVRSLLRPKNV